MLREALTGWDALQEELAEAAGHRLEHSAAGTQSGVSAAQAVVNAVCALHQAGVVRCSHPSCRFAVQQELLCNWGP